MPRLGSQLDLDRCPHCSVDRPSLRLLSEQQTKAYDGSNMRYWRWYACSRCGGVVTAASNSNYEHPVTECYPPTRVIEDSIPDRAKQYLRQAMDSKHAPAGAVMLAASSVDAMLKAKGYKEGSLYSRIDKAAQDHAITLEMAQWAHEVRLDANDQRHSDENATLPTTADADRIIEFALALSQLMFVLPARVQRGLQQSTPSNTN